MYQIEFFGCLARLSRYSGCCWLSHLSMGWHFCRLLAHAKMAKSQQQPAIPASAGGRNDDDHILFLAPYLGLRLESSMIRAKKYNHG